MEWLNAILKGQDQAIRYLPQRGIGGWSPTEDYPIDAHVQHGGVTYRAILANSEVTPGTSAATWEPWGLGIAPTAQAQALAGDAVALTPKKLDDAFKDSNQLISSTGYQKLPGGLILQWGTPVGPGGHTTTYPIQFPNAALQTVVTGFGNAASQGNAIYVDSDGYSAVGFKPRAVGSPSALITGGYSIAIGH